MYDPTTCTEDHCHAERVGLGMCARHLFRWALHREERDAAAFTLAA